MRSTATGLLGAFTLAVLLATSAPIAGQPSWTCPTPPVEPCARRHGRLSSQNGIARRIWLIGTKRVAAVANDADTVPPEVAKYLELTSDDHSYIYGDFLICPLEADRPGHMRQVCVAGAAKLVVQALRRTTPPFRILSTWPTLNQGPFDPATTIR